MTLSMANSYHNSVYKLNVWHAFISKCKVLKYLVSSAHLWFISLLHQVFRLEEFPYLKDLETD
jgi:hypothetical protein